MPEAEGRVAVHRLTISRDECVELQLISDSHLEGAAR